MLTVVMCRSFHPLGYGGFPGKRRRYVRDVADAVVRSAPGGFVVGSRAGHWEDDGFELGAAHGYVTVIVLCDLEVQLAQVVDSAGEGFLWPERKGDGWYDAPRGNLDVVAVVPGGFSDEPVRAGPLTMPVELPAYRSIGDNRAVAVLTANQFLERDTG